MKNEKYNIYRVAFFIFYLISISMDPINLTFQKFRFNFIISKIEFSNKDNYNKWYVTILSLKLIILFD